MNVHTPHPIAPLPMPPATALEVSDPIAVFGVLSPSPSSIKRDLTTKLRGYAMLTSIKHSVIVDPHERVVFRFGREAGPLGAADELTEGDVLRLDSPGLDLPVAEMLVRRPVE
jgi:Uma2 family endonuclease